MLSLDDLVRGVKRSFRRTVYVTSLGLILAGARCNIDDGVNGVEGEGEVSEEIAEGYEGEREGIIESYDGEVPIEGEGESELEEYIESEGEIIGEGEHAEEGESFEGEGEMICDFGEYGEIGEDGGEICEGYGEGEPPRICFAPEYRIGVGESPRKVATGDLNKDGNVDIVVANRLNNIHVLLGNGDGTFFSICTYAAGGYPRDVTISDINNDNNLDIIVGNIAPRGGQGGGLSIFYGHGDGTFEPERRIEFPRYSSDNPFYENDDEIAEWAVSGIVVTEDVNNDGIEDIVVGGYGNYGGGLCYPAPSYDFGVSILLGQEDGSYKFWRVDEVPGGPEYLKRGDLNNDGNIDMIVGKSSLGNTNVGSVLSVLGSDDGISYSSSIIPIGNWISSVSLGDLNDDSILDLVASDRNSDEILVLYGIGDGTFDLQRGYDVENGIAGYVRLDDLNGDGLLDLIEKGGSNLYLYSGRGGSDFNLDQEYIIEQTGSSRIATADLNNNGKKDIIIPNHFHDNTISILLNQTEY